MKDSKNSLVIFCDNDPIITFEIDKSLSKMEAFRECGQINAALRNLGIHGKLNAHIITHEFNDGLFPNDQISRNRIAKSRIVK